MAPHTWSLFVPPSQDNLKMSGQQYIGTHPPTPPPPPAVCLLIPRQKQFWFQPNLTNRANRDNTPSFLHQECHTVDVSKLYFYSVFQHSPTTPLPAVYLHKSLPIMSNCEFIWAPNPNPNPSWKLYSSYIWSAQCCISYKIPLKLSPKVENLIFWY